MFSLRKNLVIGFTVLTFLTGLATAGSPEDDAETMKKVYRKCDTELTDVLKEKRPFEKSDTDFFTQFDYLEGADKDEANAEG